MVMMMTTTIKVIVPQFAMQRVQGVARRGDCKQSLFGDGWPEMSPTLPLVGWSQVFVSVGLVQVESNQSRDSLAPSWRRLVCELLVRVVYSKSVY